MMQQFHNFRFQTKNKKIQKKETSGSNFVILHSVYGMIKLFCKKEKKQTYLLCKLMTRNGLTFSNWTLHKSKALHEKQN